jgi:prepilin-type N-terminal cleavage/methylation domain-containing protein
MSTEYTVQSTRHGAWRVCDAECISIRQVHTPYSVFATQHPVFRTQYSVLSTQYSVRPTVHRRPMRRAFGLIEMLVAISIGSVLMGIAISLLIVLLGAEQSGRSHAERSESLQRLADQFRRDVHAAVGEVTAGGEDPTGCRLTLADGGSVRYAIGAGGISREERKGSTVVRGESYALPKDSTATFTVDRTTSPWTLSLTIVPNDASMESGHEIRIDAVLGRDHRFAEPRKERK